MEHCQTDNVMNDMDYMSDWIVDVLINGNSFVPPKRCTQKKKTFVYMRGGGGYELITDRRPLPDPAKTSDQEATPWPRRFLP